MTTQNRNSRENGLRDRRLRIVIGTEAPARRRIESTWKEEARAVLAPPVEERVAPSIVSDIEMVSALRQQRMWDVRSEPRSVVLIPREEVEAPAAPAARPASRTASGRRQWEWWQVVAPAAITLGAIWQLIWAVR